MAQRHEAIGNIYMISFEEVAITVAQDLFEMRQGSNSEVMFLNSVTISQSSDAGDPQAEMLNLVYHRGVTSGSGGTTPSANPVILGQTAITGLFEVNNTTQATRGTVLRSDNFNVQLGYLWEPSRKERIFVASDSPRLVISLETTPSDSLTLSGTAVMEWVG